MSREFELFNTLVDLPPADRAAALERECADDPALRALVLELLVSDEQLKHLTARNAVPALLRELHGPPATMVDRRIGPFRVVAEVGRGGMGAVYRAEREDGTVAQTVAIKLMRRELVDGPALQRFRLERRVLAKLDHANIARLSDAGELEDGTPYAIMEFVEGEHLITFCDRNMLTLQQRLALFRSVCEAVACAHRSLVVHRDLKSSNILVNAEGVPKLLDFGISKLIEQSGDVHATGTADRFLSPLHAAPEQIRGQQITVACDVYALGLLLYQLLTGTHAIVTEGKTPGEIEAEILHTLPTLPSAHTKLASAAVSMHLPDARALSRALRGDLDDITLRCLRKEPELRYPTVDALIADLDAFREARPVSARGGDRWYRFRKFVRRNSVVVSATVVVVAALLVGIVGFAWQARIAERRAVELEKVAQFQAGMLEQVDITGAGAGLSKDVAAKLEAALVKSGLPDSERQARLESFSTQWKEVNATDAARDLIDRTILAPAVAAIDKGFAEQPLVDARLRFALAERYYSFGLFDSALTLHEQALAIRRRLLGNTNPDTLTSINDLGMVLRGQGRNSEAERYLQEAYEGRRRVLGEEHPETLTSLNNKSVLVAAQGRLAEAEPLYRVILEKRRRVLGEEHPETITAINNLGILLRNEGKLAEAEPYMTEALAKHRRVLGDDGPNTLASINNMGALMYSLGKQQESESYFREALERRRRVLGEENISTINSINSVGFILLAQGKLDEAEPYLREALEKHARVLGADHGATLNSINNLAALLTRQGKSSEAEPLVRDALKRRRRVLGNEHPETLLSINSMCATLSLLDKHDEAEPYCLEAVDASRRVLGDGHEGTLQSINLLADLRVAQGQFAEALEVLTPAEPTVRTVFVAANRFRVAKFLTAKGRALAGLGQYADAQTKLLEASAILAASPSPDPRDLRSTNAALSELYLAWHAAEPGKGHDTQAADWGRKQAATGTP
jgi:serine/threonine-protein kinase